jgi:hypothetical protein
VCKGIWTEVLLLNAIMLAIIGLNSTSVPIQQRHKRRRNSM